MQAQGNFRAEAGLLCDLVYGFAGCFQQALGQCQSLIEKPFADRGAGCLAEAPGKGASAHKDAGGQGIQAMGLVQVLLYPFQGLGEAVDGSRALQRLLDVLRLSPLAMGRNHQVACYSACHFGAMDIAQDVQATVDSCSPTGRGNYLPFIHIEDIPVHMDRRVTACQVVGPGPMGGSAATIQQPCCGQNVAAEA